MASRRNAGPCGHGAGATRQPPAGDSGRMAQNVSGRPAAGGPAPLSVGWILPRPRQVVDARVAYAAFHLMEQPMLATCASGARPVSATWAMAS